MDILRVNIKSLKFFLLWPDDNTSLFRNIVISLLQHTSIILGSIPVFVWFAYQFRVGIDDINIVFEDLIAVLNYIGFMFIYICFRINVARIKRIIKKFSTFLKYCDIKVIEEAEKQVQFYTKGLLIYFTSGLAVYTILPQLDYQNCNKGRLSDYNRWHDLCGMPIRVWAPFEVKEHFSILYYLVLLTSTNTVANISYTVLCVTMTLIGLLIHITAQIKELRKQLLEVFDTEYKEQEPKEMDKTAERKLKHCVNYHIAIIKCTDEVFKAFNLMLVVHLGLTSIILGMICYQIVFMESHMDKLRNFLHLMGWISILFLTCFYGQLIIDESVKIADAAYESKWYNGPIRLRKVIYLIIMCSQRSLKLRGAFLGVISLETFVSIIKTAYSYFTLLLSIAK